MSSSSASQKSSNNNNNNNKNNSNDGIDDPISIDLSIAKSEFVSQPAERSLRLTCYGSSSAQTPELYLKEARSLGYILAKRGHICVNGAGSFGCMAAMNDGGDAGNGHIVGVIHEMFLVDNGYGFKDIERNTGFHKAFASATPASIPFDERNAAGGPIREILVARGNDLQQRKRLLVEKTEGLIVLPGGPGTWDELWEMACMRHLGLVTFPIVCVNINGYYTPFQDMLYRAHEDKLIKKHPKDIVHFENTAQQAVQWMEAELAGEHSKDHKPPSPPPKATFAKRADLANRTSFFSPFLDSTMESSVSDDSTPSTKSVLNSVWTRVSLIFAAGAATGVAFSAILSRRK